MGYKNQSIGKTLGKPVSQEFEDKVYEEYQQLNKDNYIDVSFMNVSTVNLKQCGLQVLTFRPHCFRLTVDTFINDTSISLSLFNYPKIF